MRSDPVQDGDSCHRQKPGFTSAPPSAGPARVCDLVGQPSALRLLSALGPAGGPRAATAVWPGLSVSSTIISSSSLSPNVPGPLAFTPLCTVSSVKILLLLQDLDQVHPHPHPMFLRHVLSFLCPGPEGTSPSPSPVTPPLGLCGWVTAPPKRLWWALLGGDLLEGRAFI